MNKRLLTQLKACGYVIRPACGMCKHSAADLNTAGSFTADYLVCEIKDDLEVHQYGACEKDFEIDEGVKDRLGGPWMQLLEKRAFTRTNRGKLVGKKVNY